MLPVNWLPPGRGYNILSARNQRLFASAIAETCKSWNIQDYTLINIFNPYYGNMLPDAFPPAYKVYYTVDDIKYAPYLQKHGPRLERAYMKEADMVLATSSQLKEDKEAELQREIKLLPNAADVDLFHGSMESPLPVPPELIGEDRQILLYMGAIGLRLDYGLLYETAKAHSDKLLLLIGPKGENAETTQIERLSNVKFIGSKPRRITRLFEICTLWVNSFCSESIYPKHLSTQDK